MGLILVAGLGGAGAYWLAGIALRPVRKVSEAARRISANTLDTRLAIEGPRDEVKELADTFDAMLARLGRTFEVQGRFVADVAHELRTPLASLRTNLEVVTADPGASLADYRAMASTQERALTRLERLVADLLILATSEQPLSRSEVTLGALLEEVIVDLKSAADTKQVICRLNNELDVVVHGDSSLLAHVFSNLIENGIYYNHPGGEVIVTLEQKDVWAIVTVADTGIGIKTEQQPHIFERFYRADCSRAQHKGGAGLGLSIVSAIVQQHGGKVQVESTPGQGSTFTVLLPL
jgi:signal transduction histidine kinase